jgi:multidrug efflux pump subunit AcrA (membrane-fusion protein)
MAHLSYSRILDVSKKSRPGSATGGGRGTLARPGSRGAGLRGQIAHHRQRAAYSRSQAEQARFKTMYQYATITAPFAGVVTKRYANTGSLIQAGTRRRPGHAGGAAFPKRSASAALPVPESAVPLIHLGEPVDVTCPALHRAFPGEWSRFSDKVDESTRTMKTEVDVPNPTLVLVPGMYAEVDLITEQRKNVLTVPVEAVDGAGSSARVFTVQPSGAIRDRSGGSRARERAPRSKSIRRPSRRRQRGRRIARRPEGRQQGSAQGYSVSRCNAEAVGAYVAIRHQYSVSHHRRRA